MSCDFESPMWDSGFCNWEHDFASADTLQWVEADSADLTFKEKWKYGDRTKAFQIMPNANSVKP